MDGLTKRDHQFGFAGSPWFSRQMVEIIFYNLITISGGFEGIYGVVGVYGEMVLEEERWIQGS